MGLSSFIKGFFYSNYFYGICSVALAIECSIQLGLPLNNPLYYILLFSATVLYYTHAYYIEIRRNPVPLNKRTAWYLSNKKRIEVSQLTFTALSGILLLLILNGLQPNFSKINAYSWIIFIFFLLLGAGYYKQLHLHWGKWGLRNNGLLKPLIIGLVWAGMVSYTPILFYDISYPGSNKALEGVTWLFFIQNWLFIAVLSILFDIKDYANDANNQLKTWVVKLGLKKTLKSIIFPISILSILSYWLIAFSQSFTIYRILFNSIPYVLLITVCLHMYQRKSILYYLAIIDGLMLVKAICGILGMFGN
jgi:4-hydroxybenzoate polyprenyltransferase